VPFDAVHYPNRLNKRPGEPCVWQAPDEYFTMYGYSPDSPDVKQRYQATVTALEVGIGRVLMQVDDLSSSLADTISRLPFSILDSGRTNGGI
jgi:hypothetical protein